MLRITTISRFCLALARWTYREVLLILTLYRLPRPHVCEFLTTPLLSKIVGVAPFPEGRLEEPALSTWCSNRQSPWNRESDTTERGAIPSAPPYQVCFNLYFPPFSFLPHHVTDHEGRTRNRPPCRQDTTQAHQWHLLTT